jgi:Protein of unknown function (DUF2844)
MRLLLLLAALGGSATSIDADRVKVQGALLRVQTADRYTLHEIQSAAGTTIREYVSPAGNVFAVAWNGPAMPDLRQVFGEYYSVYQQEVERVRRTRRGRGPIAVDNGNLVVQISGHMRSLTGRAYVKQLVPNGLDPAAIR